jgi:NAD(P)-dependent dehydrogenase (short-subunit alcohol dehydrogenase family)
MALEALSLSLAQEVAPLGIKVTAVEPGMFRTEFLSQDSIRWATDEIADYATTSGRMREAFRTAEGTQRGDPARAAEAIIAAVEAPEPPLNLVLGPDAVDRARARLKALSETLDTWEHIGRGTDFRAA